MKTFTTTAIVLAFATLGVACSPIHHTIKNTPSIQTATLDTAQEIAQLSYIENLKSPVSVVWVLAPTQFQYAKSLSHHFSASPKT